MGSVKPSHDNIFTRKLLGDKDTTAKAKLPIWSDNDEEDPVKWLKDCDRLAAMTTSKKAHNYMILFKEAIPKDVIRFLGDMSTCGNRMVGRPRRTPKIGRGLRR